MFKAEIIRTNLATAETIKYASNSLLALLISFSNEFANISETINNVDVDTVLKTVCLDKRISPLLDKKRISPEIVSYLRAGCGFGGSCFPKDLKGIIHFAKSKNYDPKMLESIISINNAQMSHLVERLKKQMNLDGKRIAVLGLSFKPDTDDIRESPSIRLINNLLDENANVVAHDPVAMENTKILFKNRISFASSKFDALKDSDACFVVTAWDEYKKIDESDFKRLMKNPIVIDCRRLYKVEKMKDIKYIGTGLG